MLYATSAPGSNVSCRVCRHTNSRCVDPTSAHPWHGVPIGTPTESRSDELRALPHFRASCGAQMSGTNEEALVFHLVRPFDPGELRIQGRQQRALGLTSLGRLRSAVHDPWPLSQGLADESSDRGSRRGIAKKNKMGPDHSGP
jgi:hypothetical protein